MNITKLRKQVLQEVDSIMGEHLDGLVGTIERAILRRQAEPERWAAFHREMARRLPKWRRIAKAWHRYRARRYEAMKHAANSDLVAALRKAFPNA
jgi:hypothetical protein